MPKYQIPKQRYGSMLKCSNCAQEIRGAQNLRSHKQTCCHGSDFALTPPPVNSGHVQHLAPIRRTSSIFQHHSDPIPVTPVAEITASPLSHTRLPLLPSHPLILFTGPLSRFHLHIPFTTHPSLCHMLRLLFSLSYHHRPSRPYRTSRFTIASDFHEHLFLYYASCIVYSRVEGI
jgi:hypothetical protein